MSHVFCGLSCFRLQHSKHQRKKNLLYRVFQFYSPTAQFSGLLLRTVVQQVHNELIGGQHDGRVRDLPDELREEPSVKGEVALFPEDQPCGLHEGLVLGALLPQPRPYDFCRETHMLYATDKLHFQATRGVISKPTSASLPPQLRLDRVVRDNEKEDLFRTFSNSGKCQLRMYIRKYKITWKGFLKSSLNGT